MTQPVDASPSIAHPFAPIVYPVAVNVREMRILPVHLAGVLSLVAATLTPFIPVLLLVLPLEELRATRRNSCSVNVWHRI